MGHKPISQQILEAVHEFNERMLVLRAKVAVNYGSCENIAESCSTCHFHCNESEFCVRYARADTDIIFSCVCDDYWPMLKDYDTQPPNYRITSQPGCLSCEYDDKDGFCAYIQDETEYFDNFICDKYQLKEKK